MATYLRLFETEAEYIEFMNSDEFVRPNLSYVVSDGDVKFHSVPIEEEPKPEVTPMLSMIFNVNEGENLTFNEIPTNATKLSVNGNDVAITPAQVDTKVIYVTNETLDLNNLSPDLIIPEANGIIIETINNSQSFDDDTILCATDGVYTEKLTLKDVRDLGIITYNSNKIEVKALYGCAILFYNNDVLIDTKQTFNIILKQSSLENEIILSEAGSYEVKMELADTTLERFNFSRNQIEYVGLNGIRNIPMQCFSGCTNLSSVSLGYGLQEIDYRAFQGCVNLTSITLPETLTYIESYSFSGCSNLTSINIPESVTYIGDRVFEGCNSLPIIDNVRYADTCAVENIDKEQEYCIFKEGTRYLGGSGFMGSKFSAVTIPDTVVQIGFQCFRNSHSLKTITLSNSITTIEEVSLANCGFESIVIPDSVTSIKREAFSDCTNLKNVVIGKNVKTIAYGAFADCSSLTSIDIPDSVTGIGNLAFGGCYSLTAATIGSGFSETYGNIFFSCPALTTLSVSTANTSYDSRENCNCLINTSANTIMEGTNNSFIPEGIVAINGSAFTACSGLTSIDIPDSVTFIGNAAFCLCQQLTAITIGNGITSIEPMVFCWCTNLTNVSIPDTIVSIGENAFAFCTGLTSVHIGNGVASIGEDAFYICTNLSSITTTATVAPSIYAETFYGVKRNGTLYHPSGSDYSSWLSKNSYYLGYYNWTSQEI